MLYPINDILYSIQGEGFHAGRAAVFIRLAGCNLNCSWCDTDHSKTMEMNSEEITSVVLKLWAEDEKTSSPFVVITGGEPTIHSLMPLLEWLQGEDCYIAIETNGTRPETLEHIKNNDIAWITVSPKSISTIVMASLKHADEIKFVLSDGIDPEDFASFLSNNPHMYIQPCSENYKPAIDYVMKHPEWRLSTQTQKIMKIR